MHVVLDVLWWWMTMCKDIQLKETSSESQQSNDDQGDQRLNSFGADCNKQRWFDLRWPSRSSSVDTYVSDIFDPDRRNYIDIGRLSQYLSIHHLHHRHLWRSSDFELNQKNRSSLTSVTKPNDCSYPVSALTVFTERMSFICRAISSFDRHLTSIDQID